MRRRGRPCGSGEGSLSACGACADGTGSCAFKHSCDLRHLSIDLWVDRAPRATRLRSRLSPGAPPKALEEIAALTEASRDRWSQGG